MRFRLNFFRLLSLVVLAWGLNELRLRPDEYVTQLLVIVASLYLFGTLSAVMRLRAQANALLRDASEQMDYIKAERERLMEKVRAYEQAMERAAAIESELETERAKLEDERRKRREQAGCLH